MKKITYILVFAGLLLFAGCRNKNQAFSSDEISASNVVETSQSSMTSLEKDVLQEKIDLISQYGEKSKDGKELTNEEKEIALATLTDLANMDLSQGQQSLLNESISLLPEDIQKFAQQLME